MMPEQRTPQNDGERVIAAAIKRRFSKRTLSYRIDLIPTELTESVLLDLDRKGYMVVSQHAWNRRGRESD